MLIFDPSFPCNLNMIYNMEGSNLVVCIVCYALYGLAWLPKTTRLWGFADDFFLCQSVHKGKGTLSTEQIDAFKLLLVYIQFQTPLQSSESVGGCDSNHLQCQSGQL